MTKLFIVGIPREMEETELAALFMPHGSVISVTIITHKETGQSLGYGFIQIENSVAADNCIAKLDGQEIAGRKISVRIADDKRTTVTKPKPVDTFERSIPKYVKIQRTDEGTKKKRPRRPLN